MTQQYKIGTHRTSIFQDNGYTHIVYHQTAVVKFNDKKIVLNNGGWYSATTKARMNQTANQFNLNFGVYQRNWEWYVKYNGKEMEYQNNMVLQR